MRRLLNNEEAAEFLGCTASTLRVWVSKRRIPFVRVNRLVRFDPATLEEFVRKNSVPAEL
jgi:excisionase family DNA binding protein